MYNCPGGGVRAGGAVGLRGGGRERGVAARGAARRPAQGGLCRLVVRAPRRWVHTVFISRLAPFPNFHEIFETWHVY